MFEYDVESYLHNTFAQKHLIRRPTNLYCKSERPHLKECR